MGYYYGNNSTIKRAFKRLAKNENAVIESGMVDLLREAMYYAISIHDHHHFAHRIIGDSYGWALLKDGVIQQLAVNGGRHGYASAEEQLRQVAQLVTRSGWVGIVLASMSVAAGGRKPFFFEVDYELGVLNMTRDNIADHFAKYFKPIAV